MQFIAQSLKVFFELDKLFTITRTSKHNLGWIFNGYTYETPDYRNNLLTNIIIFLSSGCHFSR